MIHAYSAINYFYIFVLAKQLYYLSYIGPYLSIQFFLPVLRNENYVSV